jgi:hypothetical protein
MKCSRKATRRVCTLLAALFSISAASSASAELVTYYSNVEDPSELPVFDRSLGTLETVVLSVPIIVYAHDGVRNISSQQITGSLVLTRSYDLTVPVYGTSSYSYDSQAYPFTLAPEEYIRPYATWEDTHVFTYAGDDVNSFYQSAQGDGYFHFTRSSAGVSQLVNPTDLPVDFQINDEDFDGSYFSQTSVTYQFSAVPEQSSLSLAGTILLSFMVLRVGCSLRGHK